MAALDQTTLGQQLSEEVGSGIRLWVLFHCLLKAFISHHKPFKEFFWKFPQVVSQLVSSGSQITTVNGSEIQIFS